MDHFTPDMIGKVVTVTASEEVPKTVKRMTGRFPHEVDVPGEKETKSITVMGRLVRVQRGPDDVGSALWLEGARTASLT